jgi:phospholipid/cholesterol/gamma-HCH transport system substrate-binding protein
MDRPRSRLVGFLAVLVLVVGILVVFARFPALFRRGVEYRTSFASVVGLERGADVRFGGIPVGAVIGLEIDQANPQQIGVRFRVNRSIPVTTDTRAVITQAGLLGEPFVDLRPGRRDAPALRVGGHVPGDAQPSLQEAVVQLARFLDRADTLMLSVNRLADSFPMARMTDVLSRVDRTLRTAERVAVSAEQGSTRAFAGVERTSARIADLADRSERLIAAVDTVIRGAGPQLRGTQQELVATLHELQGLVREMTTAFDDAGGASALVRNLAETSENLARLTERIERDPANVLRPRAIPSKPAGPAIRRP